MDTYVMTIPRTVPKRALKVMIDVNDCKKWIIGKETGKNGYEHWQVRLQTSNGEFFMWIKQHIPTAHVEQSTADWSYSYEAKEGKHWKDNDTNEVLIQRFGKLTDRQKGVIKALGRTNDREIVCWVDLEGNHGKSWLIGHLWETGQAHVCQSQDTVKGMVQDIASDYIKHGWRPIVVIDLPRTWKWTTDLYCAIERIKDGLIKDTRYSSSTINIKGIKVLVCTNSYPKLDKLSEDRWVLIVERGGRAPFS
ncbi:replication-associated protein [Porprismacovirus canid3]|uniref:Replication-associated protein n=1 Tax=Raccoon dog stool-associated smacovirus 4 TaxID=2829092 RepID=A0AAE7UUI3_9VIRU|nr:replication-associated protein [Raccoon dog stool-associated smacovirus 4]